MMSSAGSVASKYYGDVLTPAFASDLPDEFFEVPALWVHGHTHTPADYRRGACRVVSNPRGYRMKDSSFENYQFDSCLVIDLVTLGTLADPTCEPTDDRLVQLGELP